jgi:hypothetical protein
MPRGRAQACLVKRLRLDSRTGEVPADDLGAVQFEFPHAKISPLVAPQSHRGRVRHRAGEVQQAHIPAGQLAAFDAILARLVDPAGLA